MHSEYQYLDILKDILENGERVQNRTGVDTYRLLGQQMRFDFSNGFPLLTTKKVWFKGVAIELLWFLSGSTNIKYLVDNGVNIWNDDAYKYYLKNPPHPKGELFTKDEFVAYMRGGTAKPGEKPALLPGMGELGPVYGAQWRKWIHYSGTYEPIDQVENLINGLKNNPTSRRHILSAWNVADIDQCALPPCHAMSQFTISNGKLWCHMYQRSADMFLGVPFNIASYSLLTYMIAHVTGLEPGGFIHTIHDAHIYCNHEDAVREQLKRKPGSFPTVNVDPTVKNIDDFNYGSFVLMNYRPHKTIKAELNT